MTTPQRVIKEHDTVLVQGTVVHVYGARADVFLIELGDGETINVRHEHIAAAEAERDRLREALRNARAAYVEHSNAEAADRMVDIINDALGDAK